MKGILFNLNCDNLQADWKDLLPRALFLYCSRPQTHRQLPYFLVYGVKPPAPNQTEDCSYVWDYTDKEELANAKWLINQQEKHKEARRWANSAKAVRDATRSFSQEEKAELRRWMTRDWVLKVRAQQHILEPYYNGPFQVIKAFPNNTYCLAMVLGVELQGIYSGDNLFPAYVSSLQPTNSYWNGSKPLLPGTQKTTWQTP